MDFLPWIIASWDKVLVISAPMRLNRKCNNVFCATDLVKQFGIKTLKVPTAGAQAFPMDEIGRLGHDPPHGSSADWWVLMTADAVCN
ncbi:hypothetical protein evm_008078 [Chilo suppressalis]|nr:hypothetical protein evm_008078 [Chilo suppressalis]